MIYCFFGNYLCHPCSPNKNTGVLLVLSKWFASFFLKCCFCFPVFLGAGSSFQGGTGGFKRSFCFVGDFTTLKYGTVCTRVFLQNMCSSLHALPRFRLCLRQCLPCQASGPAKWVHS